MTKVSVVIPNYNGKKYLRDCIESLIKQEYIDYEVIIIDNASTDSTYKWLEEYKYIRFKRLGQNYGFSKAVNEGIKLSKGEYVLLLNNDTVIEKDFIKELVSSIEQDNKIFAVSSKMIAYHNREVMDDAGDEYTLMGWTFKRGDGKSVDVYNKPCKVFSACAGAALYRREVFEKIGYFDEHFFAYMEDVDISYRARIYGYYNVYCPKAKVYHIGSATSGSRHNAFKVRLAARNNVYVAYKNMPLVFFIVNSIFIVLGWLIKYLFFCKKGLGKVYREGLIEGIKECRHLEKIPFRWRHLKHYFHIESLMVKNLWGYIKEVFR